MQIELWFVTNIKPYDKNPRISDDAVDAVAESIRRFGFRGLNRGRAEGILASGRPAGRAGLREKVHGALAGPDNEPADCRWLRFTLGLAGSSADRQNIARGLRATAWGLGCWTRPDLDFVNAEVDGFDGLGIVKETTKPRRRATRQGVEPLETLRIDFGKPEVVRF